MSILENPGIRDAFQRGVQERIYENLEEVIKKAKAEMLLKIETDLGAMARNAAESVTIELQKVMELSSPHDRVQVIFEIIEKKKEG